MRYWLLRRAPHYTDIQTSFAGKPWPYDKVFADPRLEADDVVYLTGAYDEIYGWGYVTKKESYQDPELESEALRITVTRPVIRQQLVPAEETKRVPELEALFTKSETNIVLLSPAQVNSFNRLLRSKGVESPSDLDIQAIETSTVNGTQGGPRTDVTDGVNESSQLARDGISDVLPVSEGTSEQPTSSRGTTISSSDPSRFRNETIFPASVSDQPAKADALGFEPYVKAIADFLTNERTVPPLTLSVEGEWGCGKSSFMTQLEALLRERGQLTVEFNAWRHDKEDEVWAAFALEFIKQISQKQSFFRRWHANFSLRRRRYDWANGWLDLLRAATTWMLVLLAIIGLPILLFFKGIGWIAQLAESISDGSLIGRAASWIAGLGTVFAAIVALISVWLKLKDYIGNPITLELKKHIKSPNYEERVAFIERFHADLKQIVSCYVGRKNVYVLIDDLDRCEVPKAADLMQSINLMIANDPQLVFIIGMDREKIAAGLAVKYEKLLPYLDLSGSQLGRTSGMETFDPARGLAYGYQFIEKFIQLPFRIPQPAKRDLRRLLESIDVTAVGHGPGRARWWSKVRPFIRLPRRSGGEPEVGVDLSSQVKAADETVTRRAQSSPSSPSEKQIVRRRQILNLINGDTETETVREIVMMATLILGDNPRRVKQFINLFRLKAHIANETGLFDIVEGSNAEGVLTLEQLGKFVALTQRYPSLLTDLEEDKELLKKLEYIAGGMNLPEGLTESPQLQRWAKISEIAAFLNFGLGVSASSEPNLYSFSDVKVQRLLQVSPRVPRQIVELTDAFADEVAARQGSAPLSSDVMDDTEPSVRGEDVVKAIPQGETPIREIELPQGSEKIAAFYDLNESDALVFKAACERARESGYLKHVSVRELLKDLEAVKIDQSEIFDSLEILTNEGYIQPNKTVGGGLPINDFEITVFGFEQYAKAYIPDHDSMVESVIDQIVRLKKDVFDKPDVVVEHILDKLVADGQLQVAKFQGGKIRITHVSAQLRRKYEDDEAERSADETEPRRDSILGAAVELGEEVRFKAERDAWWASDKGQATAKKEVEHLFNELQRLGDEITKQESQMAATFENDGQGFCILYCRGISLTASWNPGRFVNRLEGSGLHMKLTEGRISLSQNVVEVDEPKEIRHVRYDIDMAFTREIGWRETQGNKQVLASAKIAEMWVRNLIDEIRKRVAVG